MFLDNGGLRYSTPLNSFVQWVIKSLIDSIWCSKAASLDHGLAVWSIWPLFWEAWVSPAYIINGRQSLQAPRQLPGREDRGPPDAQVKPPDAQVKPADGQVKPPDAEAKPPDTEAKPPDAEAKPPDAEAKPPDAEAKPPDAEAKPPDAEAKPPDAEAKPPDAETKPLDAEAKPADHG